MYIISNQFRKSRLITTALLSELSAITFMSSDTLADFCLPASVSRPIVKDGSLSWSLVCTQ